MSVKQTKIKSAILELIRLITSRGGTIEFLPPGDKELKGEFYPDRMNIKIYKERTHKLSETDVFVLAHEYRHMCQYLNQDEMDYWLFAIDAVHVDDEEASERLELDADRWAYDFMNERKLKTPKQLIERLNDE